VEGFCGRWVIDEGRSGERTIQRESSELKVLRFEKFFNSIYLFSVQRKSLGWAILARVGLFEGMLLHLGSVRSGWDDQQWKIAMGKKDCYD